MSQPDPHVAQCVVDNIHYDEARKAIVMYGTAQNNQKIEAIIKTRKTIPSSRAWIATRRWPSSPKSITGSTPEP